MNIFSLMQMPKELPDTTQKRARRWLYPDYPDKFLLAACKRSLAYCSSVRLA
jgi:hypothetical protein